MYEWPVRELVRVVDADTFDCRIDRGFGETSTFRFRVYGIDTPEVYGEHATPRGKDASAFASAWWAEHGGHFIVARSYKGTDATVGIGDGAFGRWLASFTCEDDGADYAADVTAAGLLKHPDGT